MTSNQILDFLKSHYLMVISSTSDEGTSQSALVGFGQTDKLEIIFGTSINSRKAKNITSNPKVSIVIGWDNIGTLQYEGIAKLLIGKEVNKYSELYFSKSPGARKYKDDKNEGYFLVTPKWIRLTDVTKNPWKVDELNF